MGVPGLWNLLEPAKSTVEFSQLSGKIIAVDMNIWLHQAVKSRASTGGSKDFLAILFRRLCKLLYFGIRPIFIFDGQVSVLKRTIMAIRRKSRARLSYKAKQAQERLMHRLLKRFAENEVKRSNSVIHKQLDGENNSIKQELMKRLQQRPDVQTAKADEELFRLQTVPPKKSENLLPETAGMEYDELARDFLDGYHSVCEKPWEVDLHSEAFNSLPLQAQLRVVQLMRKILDSNSYSTISTPNNNCNIDKFSYDQMQRLLLRRRLSERQEQLSTEISRQEAMQQIQQLNQYSLLNKLNLPPLDNPSTNQLTVMRIQSCASGHAVLIRRNSDLIKSVTADTSLDSLIQSDSSTSNFDEKIDQSSAHNHQDQLPNTIAATNYKSEPIDSSISTQNEDDNGDQLTDKLATINRSDIQYNTSPSQNMNNQIELKMSSHFIENDDDDDNGGGSDNELLQGSKTVPNPTIGVNSFVSDDVNEVQPLDRNLNSDLNEKSTKLADDTEQIPANKLYTNEMNPLIGVETKTDNPIIKQELNVDVISCDDDDDDDEFVEVPYADGLIEKESLNKALEFDDDDDQEDENDDDDDDDVGDDDNNDHEVIDVTDESYKSSHDELLQTNDYNLINESWKNDNDKDDVLRDTADRFTRQAQTVGAQCVGEAQKLLELFGFPYLFSPEEAEAQCVTLQHLGLVDMVASDDSDVWPFGAKLVCRHLFGSGRKQAASNHKPSLYHLSEVNKVLGLNLANLIRLTLLCGSDYTTGVDQVGTVTAMEIIGEFTQSSNDIQFNAIIDQWIHGRSELSTELVNYLLDPLNKFVDWLHDSHRSVNSETINSIKRKLTKLNPPKDFPQPNLVRAYLHPNVDTKPDKFEWTVPDVKSLLTHMQIVLGWNRNQTEATLQSVLKHNASLCLGSVSNHHLTQKQTTLDQYVKSDQQDVITEMIFASKRTRQASSRLRMKIQSGEVKPATDSNESCSKKDVEQKPADLIKRKKRTKKQPKQQASNPLKRSKYPQRCCVQRVNLSEDDDDIE